MAIIGISGKIGSGKDTVGKIIQYITSEFNGSFDEYVTRDLGGSIWEIRKFATKLKIMVCLLTGCTLEQLEDQNFKNQELGSEWDWYKTIGVRMGKPIYLKTAPDDKIREQMGDRVYKMTYRELLQILGTEALRDIIHENVHVNALFADYTPKINYLIRGNKVNYVSEDLYDQGLYDKKHSQNWIITDTRFPNEAKAIKDRGGIIIRIERDWKIKRRKELELSVPEGMYDISSTGITCWTGKGGYIEFQLALEEKANEYIKPHPSETSLDSYNFDYTIDNSGTIEELIETVKQILIKEKIINGRTN
jgi:hypothetical protein